MTFWRRGRSAAPVDGRAGVTEADARPLPSGPSGGGSKFRSATLRVTIGSALGYLITLLLTPVLSRLFGPEAFGLSATVIAVISVFTGISTFRLEVFAQRSTDEQEARTIFRYGLLCAASWGLLVSVVALVAWWQLEVDWPWLLVGPLVFLASLQLIGGAVLTRQRRYTALATANFTQGAGTGVAQMLLGFVQASPLSLVLGFGAARLVWFFPLSRLRAPRDSAPVRVPDEVRRDAPVAGVSALVNSLGGQLTILVASALYGAVEAGLLAMAIRLLVSPLAIIGQAAAAASIGELGRLIRAGSGEGASVVKSAMRDLALVGAVPCVGLALVGLFFASPLLGPEWEQAGQMMALLAPGTLLQFAVSPFSQLLNITGRSRQLLVWDVVRVVVLSVALVLPWHLGASILVTVACYSATLIPLYVWMAVLVRGAIRSTPREVRTDARSD